jgi:hypothetical protein
MTEQFFETQDTGLGAFLLSSRIPYRGAFLTEGRVTFRFANLNGRAEQEIREVIDQYRFDFPAPSAKGLIANYQFLLAQVKEARRKAAAGGGQ